jgi:RHS repeat-associated protein
VFRNGYLDFYGVDGSLLGEYSPGWPDGFTACNVSVYFGKRMLWRGWGYNFFTSGETINADRLGSAVYDWTDAPKYFPYGDEPSTTQQNRPKFATYYRDGTTALDYAQQRYYASTLGRFTSPDPYQASGGPEDPQSWNRYAYVQNDPVNYSDPDGLIMLSPEYLALKRGLNFSVPFMYNASFASVGGLWPAALDMSPSDVEPPVLPPSLGGKPTPEQRKKFEAAWKEVSKRLNKPDCAKLFGEAGAGASFFTSAPFTMGTWMDPGTTNLNESVYLFTDPLTATININYVGHFFDIDVKVSVPGGVVTVRADMGTGLGDKDFRAFTLLHELGHLSGKLGDDGTDPTLADAFNTRIMKDCFGMSWTPATP